MNLPFKIALKYFAGKLTFFKKWNSIQLLTAISIAMAAAVSLAAIVILSVLNGMMTLVGDLNTQFNPDIKVSPLKSKVIELDSTTLGQIRAIDGVAEVAEVLEEVALFEYFDKQKVGKVRGVDSNFLRVSNMEENLIRGSFELQREEGNYAVIGLGIANELAVNLRNPLEVLTMYIPTRKARVSFGGMDSQFSTTGIRPGGEFAIQKEFDDQYVFVPISMLRPLLSYPNHASHLEVKLSDENKKRKVQKSIRGLLGEEVEVLDRFQQNKSWYKVMQFEKWATFGIIALVMLIASFNLISSLTMMVLDKKKDISILKSMGLENTAVGSVFRWQGFLIGLVGAGIGAILAIGLIFLQQQFGLIKMQGSFVVDAYPTTLKWQDVLLTITTIVGISWLAALPPSKKAEKQLLEL
ncbi:MAG: FtsX-like permease family protein [Saprospiraceae bacterium]|nr:FtsX-like permease family protein [Saprospiraceae bacterium]